MLIKVFGNKKSPAIAGLLNQVYLTPISQT